MQRFKGLTWPQIRYWGVSLGLLIVGFAATTWGGPWQSFTPIVNWFGPVAKELGPGIFTAGILACLVEPFFRNEFARDAFLAAFRYVLPSELKDEVAKILTLEFIAESHVWAVDIKKVDNNTVLVTSNFERTLVNKTIGSSHRQQWVSSRNRTRLNATLG